MANKRLRLILGDQLNLNHHWFESVDPDTVYLLAELHQEAHYVMHHIQKVCAFFSAMTRFAETLRERGHQVKYLNLDDTAEFSDLPALLVSLMREESCDTFEYQQPDEWRLHVQLEAFCSTLKIESSCVESDHFFLKHDELASYIQPNRHNRMETFYRKMRKRFGVLMAGDEPIGGAWNFDEDNRKAFKKADLMSIPQPLVFDNDVRDILARIERHHVATFGQKHEALLWPVDRAQALSLLRYFCEVCLPNFGRFQDAMTQQSPYAWSLFHSRISFALNVKLIGPHEVIDKAIEAYHEDPMAISIAQIEGFVRQILGWREYVRAVYWVNMPGYSEQNVFNAEVPLPKWFWDGDTKMSCMQRSIDQSLEFAYAHHIQRLMIIGNFSLLTGLDPVQVDEWYLGVYIDAIEWVEMPNTRGMALFADGGWIATKPYAASGNYINKMSDYCKGCHYKVKEKVGASACPFNSLYWDFIDRNARHLSHNQRLAFVNKQWEKKDIAEKRLIKERAAELRNNLNEI